MKPYFALIRGGFIIFSIHRYSFIFTFIGNLLYILLIYFLWKSIFTYSPIINGMTFRQTFLYLALAGAIFTLFKTWVDWTISRKIIQGSIIVDLIRPLDFQIQALFLSMGSALASLVFVTLPSVLVVFWVVRTEIGFGVNLLFFPIVLVFAFLLSFLIDYAVGLSSFYTESLWGISMTKDVLISLLSGALIPLQFFPEWARSVLQLLPFQAIYHIPLLIVTTPTMDVRTCVMLLAIQLFWVGVLFVLSRLFYRHAIRVLTVSGG